MHSAEYINSKPRPFGQRIERTHPKSTA
uniref:Uncharacterized protein n=1 Tax=Arundo donax TaxID=35708 RepID=A0A0A9B581_ARUDO